ncbi:hypothetical protein [Methanoregula sp. UBA64]|jgi:hypothetical protein|uniref:hypothetical protein n=1 Tax=Methanoregula sp. UBA64 TaxID=1915554 RepID=UPI0025D8188F|nr:hypothetical protein [Methanoregula sp. UBA64]
MTYNKDSGGINGQKGYSYQSVLALYYLIVKESREIEWECDGEDFTVINEEDSYKSINFIQAKHQNTGSFSLAQFKNEVFPQFWRAFLSGVREHSEKLICCTLVTDIAQNHDLKVFGDAGKKIRESGWRLSDVEKSTQTIKHYFQSMRKGKKPEDFKRFLFGLKIIDKFTADQMQLEIANYLKDCGVSGPKSKIREMLQFIVEKDQGLITRTELENLAGKRLSRIITGELSAPPSKNEISSALLSLSRIKQTYCETPSTFPDKDTMYRDLTTSVFTTTKVLEGVITNSSKFSVTQQDIDQYISITVSDRHHIEEESKKIVDLEEQLWISKTKFKQSLSSIEKTFSYFEIEEDQS